MEEFADSVDRPPPVEILRHRAAIRRTEPSLPLKCLVRDRFLIDGHTFFDYGCGYGDDLEFVRRLGLTAAGWDPAYRPSEPIVEADVVNLGYVINVIEDQLERIETLRSAWQVTKKVLSVSARIAVDGSGDGEFEFGDGVITRIQTFQKYYTQFELRQYLEQTLDTEPVSAAPGVFYLFKEASLHQQFTASKYRRRSFAPRRRASEVEFDRNRELLEALIQVSGELARLPFPDEFDRTDEVIAKFGSLKRAFTLIRKVTGSDPWDTLRQDHIDDLRVYLALSRFPKRPAFADLPLTMRRDIKEFFGGYKSACESADALLFDSGRTELIDLACQTSAVGRLTSNALYIHRSAVSSLAPILRVFEGCARAYLGDVEDANVVKLHRFSGKVSYLAVPQFDTHPHPPVRRTIKLSLRHLALQCIDHTENKNPLLLDRKERMIESDHPWYPRFSRVTLQEFQHGLLDDADDMRLAVQWNTKLVEAGLMIRGNRLLYQEGVKRKRLPPRRLFSQATISEESEEAKEADQDRRDFEPQDYVVDESIDSDAEDQVAATASRTPELPVRSRRFGIGKEIGYAVYLHRDYEDRLGSTVEWAKRHLPTDYEYNVVKLNQRNDSVSFIHCPAFDIEHEPAIATIMVVNANGNVQNRNMPSDPYIYHHKWLFVDDNYQRFDVDESRARSKRWIAIPDVDRSRIGTRSYWEEMVVPRLKETTMPNEPNPDRRPETAKPTDQGRWVRSDEARKLLKLSTCDLAHAREAGKIPFKKSGNAYLYRIDGTESADR
jgi:DNA phosphorothioation-associated putative methyltransferase